jgi:hypothetical protein
MRITDQNGNVLTAVYLALSDSEASELRDALTQLLGAPKRGWHVHVSDSTYQVEVTVYRADDPTAAM